MAKRVSIRPEWLQAEGVRAVYSVSGCLSANFADYIKYWRHNGYWFFDSPEIMQQLMRDNDVDLAGTTPLYYEA